jgi:hypothetical protein
MQNAKLYFDSTAEAQGKRALLDKDTEVKSGAVKFCTFAKNQQNLEHRSINLVMLRRCHEILPTWGRNPKIATVDGLQVSIWSEYNTPCAQAQHLRTR